MIDFDLVERIQATIKRGLNDDLQKLFLVADKSDVIDRPFVYDLWYKNRAVEKLRGDQLEEVAKALIPEYAPERQDYSDNPQQGFIDCISRSKDQIDRFTSYFNEVKPYEERFGCDVTLFSKEQAVAMFHEMPHSTREKLRRMLSTFSKYTRWRGENGFPVGGAFLGNGSERVKLEDIAEITKETTLFSVAPLTPRDVADKIESEAFNVGDVSSVVMCLSWMGFTAPQMLDMRLEDVDSKNGYVYDEPIPQEFVYLFKLYDKMHEKVIETGRGPKICRKQNLGRYISRWVPVKQRSGRDMSAKPPDEYTISYSMREFTGVNASTVRRMGMCYRLYQRELLKGRVDDSDFLDVFGYERTTFARNGNLRKDCFLFYEQYKEALRNQEN